ncbi:hypothetical protein D5086_019475 [Populus alba]|uniref:Uncharacterized protein n=1 Tax=Populus alba TaxID=43335 RepID=A0ACC4BIX6_POPAL
MSVYQSSINAGWPPCLTVSTAAQWVGGPSHQNTDVIWDFIHWMFLRAENGLLLKFLVTYMTRDNFPQAKSVLLFWGDELVENRTGTAAWGRFICAHLSPCGTIGEATNFAITEVHTAEDTSPEIGVTFSFLYVHLCNLEVSS